MIIGGLANNRCCVLWLDHKDWYQVSGIKKAVYKYALKDPPSEYMLVQLLKDIYKVFWNSYCTAKFAVNFIVIATHAGPPLFLHIFIFTHLWCVH